jgi:hypothetical protein
VRDFSYNTLTHQFGMDGTEDWHVACASVFCLISHSPWGFDYLMIFIFLSWPRLLERWKKHLVIGTAFKGGVGRAFQMDIAASSGSHRLDMFWSRGFMIQLHCHLFLGGIAGLVAILGEDRLA